MRSLVDAVMARWGHLDVLVNNAGIYLQADAIVTTETAWNRLLAVNLTGAFLCARECLKHMLRRREGHIINIASVAGRRAYPLRLAYAASKWGLIGLTLTLAQEAGARNVLVNAVCPGPVQGPVMEQVIARRARSLRIPAREVRQQFLNSAALGRMVSATDVSSLVLFLCSQAARSLTGQVIEVSAGFGLAMG